MVCTASTHSLASLSVSARTCSTSPPRSVRVRVPVPVSDTGAAPPGDVGGDVLPASAVEAANTPSSFAPEDEAEDEAEGGEPQMTSKVRGLAAPKGRQSPEDRSVTLHET